MVFTTKGSSIIRKAKLISAQSLTRSSPVASTKNLVIWLETTSGKSFTDSERVDTALTAQGTISTWNNINPHISLADNAVQATDTNKPRYVASGINGLPTLNFDGVDNRIEISLSPAITSEQLEVFIVCKRIAVLRHTSSAVFLRNDTTSDSDNTSSMLLAYEASVGKVLQTYRGSPKSSKNPHPGNAIPYIFSTKFDGVNNTAYFNGTAQGSTTSSGNFNIGRVLIGSRLIGGSILNHYNGYIAELIVFNRALSNQERNDINQYLSTKWGITIS